VKNIARRKLHGMRSISVIQQPVNVMVVLGKGYVTVTLQPILFVRNVKDKES
jgi:hypothetical protein